MVRDLMFNGQFYPEKIDAVENFIFNNAPAQSFDNNLVGLIVPHAGWVYSGITALKGYSVKTNRKIDNIYLIGPSHRFPFIGVALADYTALKTISSQISVNFELQKEFSSIENVLINNDAHKFEHSLEVQLEFIKYYYPDSTIVPIVAGFRSSDTLSKIIDLCLNDKDSLTVISSDLSHYQNYFVAQKQDSQTLKKIELSKLIDDKDACGHEVINGFIKSNTFNRYRTKLLDYRNSGDTAGSKDSVVGYCAMEIIE